MKIVIFNKTVTRQYELYDSHFINYHDLLTSVFEESDLIIIIK